MPLGREIQQVRGVLARLSLEDKLYTPVGELSGGQQQRTAVGRALYQSDKALLGDEPVSAVDEHQAHEVLDAINQRYDTVVLAMHDVKLALQHTDRVVGLKAGRIELDEPASRVTVSDLSGFYKG